MIIDGVEFAPEYYMSNNVVVWVDTDWLMRNADDSCDFGRGFDIAEMVEVKAGDSGFGHLIDSILKNGFLESGAIGFYDGEITEGHHRFAAAILLCLPRVPVTMYGNDIRLPGHYDTLVCAHYSRKGEEDYPIEVTY